MPKDLASLKALIQQQVNNNNSSGRFGYNLTPAHAHTGLDSPQVSFLNLTERQFTVTSVISGTGAATSTNYGSFWVAPFNCSVQQILQTHGANGAGGVLTVELLKSGVASGSGTSVTTFDMTTGANTVVTKNIGRLSVVKALGTGDRLGLSITGTLTGLSQVVVTVLLQAI